MNNNHLDHDEHNTHNNNFVNNANAKKNSTSSHSLITSSVNNKNTDLELEKNDDNSNNREGIFELENLELKMESARKFATSLMGEQFLDLFIVWLVRHSITRYIQRHADAKPEFNPEFTWKELIHAANSMPTTAGNSSATSAINISASASPITST